MSLLTRLLQYLKPYRMRLAGAVVCAAVVAGLAGTYAWLVKPVLDGIFINKDEFLLLVIPMAIMAVAVLKGAANYGQSYLMSYIGNKIIADVRNQLFLQLMRLPLRFHAENTTGRLMSRVVHDVNLMANAVAGVLKDLVQQGLTFLAMLAIIFYQNWKLASLSVVVVPVAVYTMNRMGRRLHRLATRGQERIGDMASILQESLSGIRMVKAFGQEEAAARRFESRNTAFRSATMKAVQISALTSPLMESIGVVGVGLIIWYGGYLVISGDMTPGAFFSFLTAMFMAYAPVRKLAGANNTIQQALSAAARVFDVLDLQNEGQADQGRRLLPSKHRTVEFQAVTFQYEDASSPAVTAVTFTAKAGQMVALVGGSGSGKTTLVHLIPRFYDPTAGTITIDGCDIREFTLASLRRQVGLVAQHTILFDETVRYNIAFGKPDARDDEIVAAARAAYAHEFVERLPHGYETLIGENGVKLSGGERQRLAIARALLHEPSILILDEATSALDSESERIVQLALANAMKNRTTFVIAHRLATVQQADCILVLKEGRIVESGTHGALLKRKGFYNRLCEQQVHELLIESRLSSP